MSRKPTSIPPAFTGRMPRMASQASTGTPLTAVVMVAMVAAGSGVVTPMSGVATRRAALNWSRKLRGMRHNSFRSG